ncbi:hypothetical protein HKD37_01G001879 [Glycine soja]
MVIHRPKRVVRQFDYIQTIPPHPVVSSLSVAEIDDRWMQFGDYIALLEDLPRVPPVQQHEEFVEANMYQQPMAETAPNEADIDQHHLRHAVDDFATIAIGWTGY